METVVQKDPWIPFQEVDFNDQSIIQYHIDTRDFNCITTKEDLTSLGDKINWDKISKYPERFYFTTEEVKSFLNRIYLESGGEGEWRMFMLDIPKNNNWNLKYIRIYRIVDDLFLITNKDSYAMNKEILTALVVTEYLNFVEKEHGVQAEIVSDAVIIEE